MGDDVEWPDSEEFDAVCMHRNQPFHSWRGYVSEEVSLCDHCMGDD